MKKKSPKASLVPSPCISVCTMDEDIGFCRGCLRTLEEIGEWERYDDAQKREILGKLALRRETLPDFHSGHC
jgi:predicted Fe-S protein YdhL (DUF1289 family)